MRQGIVHLRAAARLLENQGELRREKVTQAAEDFRIAMSQIAEVPVELRDSAAQIHKMITPKGTVSPHDVSSERF